MVVEEEFFCGSVQTRVTVLIHPFENDGGEMVGWWNGGKVEAAWDGGKEEMTWQMRHP